MSHCKFEKRGRIFESVFCVPIWEQIFHLDQFGNEKHARQNEKYFVKSASSCEQYKEADQSNGSLFGYEKRDPNFRLTTLL